MKTLKTLFLFLVLVCAGNSFGQTKEETIAWLKEKLEKYTVLPDYITERTGKASDLKLTHIDECSFTFTYTNEDGFKEIATVPTLGFEFKEFADGFFIGHKISAIKCEIYKNAEKPEKYNYSWIRVRLVEGEIDLKERMKKASAHLATFCKENKQTF